MSLAHPIAHATVTIRFRWWARPLTLLLRRAVVFLGTVTPRAWHLRITNASADLLAVLLTRFGMVVQS